MRIPMRAWLMVVAAAFVAVTGLHCSGASGGTLDFSARKTRIFEDGEQTELLILATDTAGKVGSGVVRLTAPAGTLGEASVTLDAFGTGKTTYSCNVEADSNCKGSVTLTATWNGVTAELPLRIAERCPGATLCGGQCVVTNSDWRNCGACGVQCQVVEACLGGSCQPCPAGDCDSDGWTPTTGDCCDQFDVCTKPGAVNPGAVEALGNGLDDNCNGLLDALDTLDVAACDGTLGPRATSAMDFARTLGLCRTTTETDRTWGVIAADLLLANGETGVSNNSATIRPVFGLIPAQEGARLAVLATGVASDSVQTNPSLGDSAAGTTADIAACTLPVCIKDWFMASRPPLKLSGQLPGAPNCGSGGSSQNMANDSVMLRLRIRAPTNASSFRLKSRFFSAEYPEFVCSSFNDQMVLLIDTLGANVGNPSDKNLMTYSSDGGSWPVGINLAAGTPLFQTCVSQSASPQCWDSTVNSASCGLGPGDLAYTQFASTTDGGCVRGGGTKWMVTKGNVKPGGVFELRAAVWDVGDHILDSLVLVDDFKWGVDAGEPGTGEE